MRILIRKNTTAPSSLKILIKQESVVPLDYKFLKDTLELSLPLESRQNEDGSSYFYITLTDEQYKKINKNIKLIITGEGSGTCLSCIGINSGSYSFSTKVFPMELSSGAYSFSNSNFFYYAINTTITGAGEAEVKRIPLEFPTYTPPDVVLESIGNGIDTSFTFEIKDNNYNRITDFYVCDVNGEEVYPNIKKNDSNQTIKITFAKPPKINEYLLHYCLGTKKEE